MSVFIGLCPPQGDQCPSGFARDLDSFFLRLTSLDHARLPFHSQYFTYEEVCRCASPATED